MHCYWCYNALYCLSYQCTMYYALYNTVMHYNALLFFTVLCYFELVLVCTIVPEVGVSLVPLVAGLPEISVTRSCGLRGPWTQAGGGQLGSGTFNL